MNKTVLRSRSLLMAWGMALCVGSAWCSPNDNQPEDALAAPSAMDDNNDPPLPPASDFSRTPKEKVFSVPVLRAFIRESDMTNKTQLAQKTNRFCFVQQRASEPHDQSRPRYRMIWLQGKRLFYNNYPLPTESVEDQLMSIQVSKSIHMEEDVRNTYKEINGSTFLVHRAWVDWMMAQCKRTGLWVTVPPVKKRSD